MVTFLHLEFPQGKGDGSYNNGGNYRHQDEAGEGSGGEEDKKANQGESLKFFQSFQVFTEQVVS